MAIGTIGAIALGVGALGGVASAAMSSSATNRAVNASQQATQENNALARDIYAQNQAVLRPFVQQGTTATSYINSLLGIAPPPQAAPATGGGTQPMWQGFNPDNAGSGRSSFLGQFIDAVQPMGGGGAMGVPGAFQTPQPTTGVPAAGTVPANPNAGFDAFRNSTGYNFRFNEGMRAINANQAARGLLNSGDTLRRLTQFGQDAASAEFGNFFNALAGQQSLGANAANAQTGVASNFSSQVQANNAQNASNIGNAALARAGNNNAFLSSLLGAGAYALGGRG